MPPKPRTLTTSSGETDTITNWATRTGLKQDTIRRRIREGLSADDAITPGWRKRNNAPVITWNGRSETITNWSKETGVPISTIKRRLSRGCSEGQILGFEPLPGKLYLDGQRVTLAEASRKIGICPEAIRYRLVSGWKPEEVVSVPNLRRRKSAASS